MLRNKPACLIVVLLAVASASLIAADVTGAIDGIVKDPS